MESKISHAQSNLQNEPETPERKTTARQHSQESSEVINQTQIDPINSRYQKIISSTPKNLFKSPYPRRVLLDRFKLEHSGSDESIKDQLIKKAEGIKELYKSLSSNVAKEMKDYLRSPASQRKHKKITIPQLLFISTNRTTRREERFIAAQIALKLEFKRKTNFSGLFVSESINNFLSRLKENDGDDAVVKLVNNTSVKQKLIGDLIFVRDMINYMNKVSSSLETVHYSMRALVDSEAAAANQSEVLDYSSKPDIISPIVKATCANVVQTLEERGCVWLPIDIFFGDQRTQGEKLHFVLVSLTKTKERKVEISAYETNGGFDLMQITPPLNEEGIYSRHEIRLRDELDIGDSLDFQSKPGIFNANTVEQLLHPMNRLMNEYAILRPTLNLFMESLCYISKTPNDPGSIYNPEQEFLRRQNGLTCQYECIDSAISLHPNISALSKALIHMAIIHNSGTVTAEYLSTEALSGPSDHALRKMNHIGNISSARVHENKEKNIEIIRREIGKLEN